ncbi:MAG: hypothetical protein S4CHLAM37_16400 [Chlamydiia bacterium]|nr:hypothetical protein [Chlamydiia bacterium]
MKLYAHPNRLTVSQVGHLRGYEELSSDTLKNMTAALDRTKALKSPAVAKCVATCLKETPSLDSLFSAFKGFCKRSVECLQSKDKCTRSEKASLKAIKKCFIQAAMNENRKKSNSSYALSHVFAKPKHGIFTYLNADEAVASEEAMHVLKDVDGNLINSIPVSVNRTILLNTFADYCAEHPHSFLNRVCMEAVKRESGIEKLDRGANGAEGVRLVNALKKVLSEYLLYTGDLENITLAEMQGLFSNLEDKYQTELKDSYKNFFYYILAHQLPGGSLATLLEIESENSDFRSLDDPTILGAVIQKFHKQQNQQYLNLVDSVNMPDSNLKLVPPQIQKLTNLNTLSLSSCQLQSIDLSKNTALTDLDLRENQLISIDLSKNTSLTNLYLNYNQLKSIDLSKNTALTDLNLNDNQLKSIDLSKNTSLTDLDLRENQLISIDLSKNTSLTDLYLNDNQLKSIDLSKNTALTTLYLNENQLQNIDLSKNTALRSLELNNNQLQSIDLSKNTALDWLGLHDNQLQNIDPSKNTVLERIGLSGNQLQSIDLSQNTALRSLQLSNNQLQSIDLSSNTYLSWLELSGNQLQSIDLSKNTALRELELNNNQLQSIDLSQNTALRSLQLSNNQLQSIDLTKNKDLTYSELSGIPEKNIDRL